MKLVDDAKNWWRWTSMRAMAFAVAFLGGWEILGDDLKAYLPHWVGVGVALLTLCIFGMGGRVVAQKPKPE